MAERHVVRGIQLGDQDEPGFWERLGDHTSGDPWQQQRFWGHEREATMTSSNLWSHGNALTRPLQDGFRVEVTTAIGRRTSRGRTAPMAQVPVFDHAPGIIAHCPTCHQLLQPLVQGPRHTWQDQHSRTHQQLPTPEEV